MNVDSYVQSEATAARRRAYFTLVNSTTGAAITGVASGSITKRITKPGGSDAAGSGTCVEDSAANKPGVYYYEFTTGELDTLGNGVLVLSSSGSHVRQLPFRVVAVNFNDAVRAGLTALPNANAEAAGGLYTRGTGAGQINQPANGQIDINLVAWRGVLPNNMVSNNVQTHTASMATDVVSTAAVAAGVTDEIRDAVWNATLASYTTAGTAGKKLADQTNGTVTLTTDSITAASISAGAAAKIATAVGAREIENSDAGMMTADDCVRFQNGMIAGAPLNWSADAVVIPVPSLDGTKTRAEIVTDTNGRASTEVVDPT